MSKFDSEDRKSITKAMSIFSQLAITAVVCIAFGLLVGIGLDRLFNTSPLFLIIFSILGCVASIKAMVEIARKI